jgi:hypothetical protein
MPLNTNNNTEASPNLTHPAHVRKNYPFLTSQRTRHGKMIYYVRRGQGERHRLPDDFGSASFWDAYAAAIHRMKTGASSVRNMAASPLRQKVGLAMRNSIKNAKGRSKERNLPFDLTYEWAIEQVEKQGFRCALTGIPFFSKWGDRSPHRNPTIPSIDRIVPAAGYVQSNCRIVNLAINTMMLDWGEEFFVHLVKCFLDHRIAPLTGKDDE